MTVYYQTAFGVFEWDSVKNYSKLCKHGIDFYIACNVFADNFAVIHHDYEHSSLFEDRYKIIGCGGEQRIIVIIFTDRDGITRIISARKAIKEEEREYEKSFRESLANF